MAVLRDQAWDMRSRFDTDVALAADLLPLLLERIPGRFALSDFAAFPLSQNTSELIRYRWHVSGTNARIFDLIVENGKARMEPAGGAAAEVSLRCDDSTLALLMYKRLTLEPTMSQGRLVIQGEPDLQIALDIMRNNRIRHNSKA